MFFNLLTCLYNFCMYECMSMSINFYTFLIDYCQLENLSLKMQIHVKESFFHLRKKKSNSASLIHTVIKSTKLWNTNS